MMSAKKFRATVWRYWREHGRDLPWRLTRDPYRILVSEVMLQQTQVTRVIPKYEEFIARFPTIRDLARAQMKDVLTAWQGLGYNRRALALKRAAERVAREHGGVLPADGNALQELPGVGAYTAAAVRVFAFGQTVPLLETNIRRVYLHHFFPNRREVADAELMPLVERTMVRDEPHQWFSALMDYGSYLAVALRQAQGAGANPNRRSSSYARQPKFEGSRRQLRGAVVRIVSEEGSSDVPTLAKRVRRSRGEVERVLTMLAREGFLKTKKSRIVLA